MIRSRPRKITPTGRLPKTETLDRPWQGKLGRLTPDLIPVDRVLADLPGIVADLLGLGRSLVTET